MAGFIVLQFNLNIQSKVQEIEDHRRGNEVFVVNPINLTTDLSIRTRPSNQIGDLMKRVKHGEKIY